MFILLFTVFFLVALTIPFLINTVPSSVHSCILHHQEWLLLLDYLFNLLWQERQGFPRGIFLVRWKFLPFLFFFFQTFISSLSDICSIWVKQVLGCFAPVEIQCVLAHFVSTIHFWDWGWLKTIKVHSRCFINVQFKMPFCVIPAHESHLQPCAEIIARCKQLVYFLLLNLIDVAIKHLHCKNTSHSQLSSHFSPTRSWKREERKKRWISYLWS